MLEGDIRNRIAKIGQSEFGNRMGRVSKSQISRYVSEENGIPLSELESFFNALDLVVMPKEKAEALRLLARDGLGD